MTLPAYLDWVDTEQGRWWLPRLRLKWQIVAEARRQEAEAHAAGQDEASWRRQGYHGGYCDPREVCDFDDDDAAA